MIEKEILAFFKGVKEIIKILVKSELFTDVGIIDLITVIILGGIILFSKIELLKNLSLINILLIFVGLFIISSVISMQRYKQKMYYNTMSYSNEHPFLK